ncbi:Panacea domain-containing protein [Plesiomonas shigelloides]|uniref:Panacea domain-containing protein n=1 Tax=Plesiomonas shigelloides TaxID=703 RepID=UPI001261AC44|nr:type II toxin-antitoxin system antitoxin SocA domain-containing protein [Plesiomonas shigelloides]KAB7669204.1 DUF4065 domain-containing protein [Plesiomonas shigelloides]
MSYSPITVAEKFAELAQSEGKELTHMQLQKLTYIAHGYKLAISQGQPLINDQVNAWKFGPVIPSLYHILKMWRGSPIPKNMLSMFSKHEPISDADNDLIGAVYQAYGNMNGIELSELTHKNNTPWEQIWRNAGSNSSGAIIPDELIKKYYCGFLRCENTIKPMQNGA